MVVKVKILVILAICYLVYLLIGAGIFSAIERPLERMRCENASAYVKSLYNNSNLLYRNLTRDEIKDIVNVRNLQGYITLVCSRPACIQFF